MFLFTPPSNGRPLNPCVCSFLFFFIKVRLLGGDGDTAHGAAQAPAVFVYVNCVCIFLSTLLLRTRTANNYKTRVLVSVLFSCKVRLLGGDGDTAHGAAQAPAG